MMKIFNKFDFSNKDNNLLYFILFIFLLLGIFFSTENNRLNNEYIRQENKFLEIQKILDGVLIEAEAVSVYDVTISRKIYSKNDETKMPIASIAKIMTVVSALNNSKSSDLVSITLDAIRQEGDYQFFVYEKFNIIDLAKFTLIGSSNDGAYAFAENKTNFLEKINEKAKKIGMDNTLFFNFTGLDINETTPGVFSSASDVNIMAIYASKAYPEVFSKSILPEISIKSKNGFNHNIKNTNIILDKIPNILFSKTGFTELAKGNLVIIYKNKHGHDIAITVLGSSIDGRFTDMEKIIDVLYNLDYGN
ncbi:MAG: Serine-type D-Ala-D-Ala carboxypeptidase [Candidatus Nomurabacteria bacterium GW2011_GWE1_32_28]|uniref:Serine-type D-Ala-D-Ala carboxypeptidase n=1 Tax=Candidatus Nomurabacteria bacterium GW2011_GWF1_31_48 TaxID=1618767 RepID=A0A0F9YGI9_9BACT|nr:MAG: Serine-type D-Ala-D-Ala carboxypeptidase [Candidatus Nomurabacteria bacterium GW2011_GWF2_30_133]KKP28966.1 MAG: Serine-type D-Ala-D-Ala carboxypeptidase [Candidatus Nomurabacteria bacterium GW2011_GWE2_31_40]KKP30704.1 MAG: Serine-type D-Ala-D-Ala carboxypeptidase [Candidatus Nomurabacteria bacterium GW2011_GWF1_31_48]KKP35222.1 MAG: Serine-type D-Ala-D-Ala carboxypeptidase [Candidatus Nomurabacteria bacterium GW2011_GWE1_32_28]HAS80529.1 hypothetical protein [Candidatus Nomurabacteria